MNLNSCPLCGWKRSLPFFDEVWRIFCFDCKLNIRRDETNGRPTFVICESGLGWKGYDWADKNKMTEEDMVRRMKLRSFE